MGGPPTRPRLVGTSPCWTGCGSIGLTGSKEGCAEGECGACAVLVARPDDEQRSRWTAINACLVPAAGFDGPGVLTAEGLGNPDALHPVQQEMAVRGGSQCGYCTPGFICAMAGEYYRPDRTPTVRTERVAEAEPGVAGERGRPPQGQRTRRSHRARSCPRSRARSQRLRPARPERQPVPVHRLSADPRRRVRPWTRSRGPTDPLRPAARTRPRPPVATAVDSAQAPYVRPHDPGRGARTCSPSEPDARLVAGSTDWGVELNIRTRPRPAEHRRGPARASCAGWTIGETRIDLGAALTLSEIERGLNGRVPLLAELFPQFASRLIRNGATLGGNLGTASPIGDAPPALLALELPAGAGLSRRRARGPLARLLHRLPADPPPARRADQVIRIPRPVAPVTGFHKIAKRRFDDISSVAVGYALTAGGGRGRPDRHRPGRGGGDADPRAGHRAGADRPALDPRATVREAAEVLAGEGTPLSDHRASADYRAAMLRTSLLKLYATQPAHRMRASELKDPSVGVRGTRSRLDGRARHRRRA